MQHVLPSRNVCVAYRGMTIPLPAPSLCGVFRSSLREHKPLVVGSSEIEGSPKDSGFQSQVASASELSAASPCRLTEAEGSKQANDHLIQSEQSEKHSIGSRDEIQPTESAANSCTPSPVSPVCTSSEVTPLRLSSNSKVTEGSTPKQAWMSVGRGRALQQVVSQFTSPVGRTVVSESTQSTANDESGAIVERCIVPPLQSPSEADVVDGSAGFQDTDTERDVATNEIHSLSPVHRSKAGSPDMKVEVQCTGLEHKDGCNDGEDHTSLSHALSDMVTAETKVEATSDICTSEIQVPTMSSVIESRDSETPCPPLLVSATHETCTPPHPHPHTPIEKNPRSKRISLAIQFRGVCSPQSVQGGGCTSTAQDTPCTLGTSNITPASAVLLKPRDFISPSPSTSSEQQSNTRVKAKGMVANSEIDNFATEYVGSALEPASTFEERDAQSPLTQVSDTEDYGQDLSDSCALMGSGSNEEDRGTLGSIEHAQSEAQSQHHLLCSAASDAVQSCDEDEVVSMGARMGRSTDELEKSIAVHQRNIHRNRVCMCVYYSVSLR